MAPTIDRLPGQSTPAARPADRTEAEYEPAAALDRRIRQTVRWGRKETGRGAVLVVMSEEPMESWLVTYLAPDCAGSVADLVARYDPGSEMVLCFVYPEVRRFTAYRLPLPWRANGECLH